MRWRKVTLVFLGILLILCSLQTASDSVYQAQAGSCGSAENEKPRYCIFIEIEDKALYLLKDGVLFKRFPIASGKKGWPSPLGYWKIVEKGDWGEGFGGRWLGLDVPWGKYGIHGTLFPESVGRAASHGCIRMYNKHVKELYDIVPQGTPVVIVNGIYGPFGRGFKELNPGDRGADVLAIQQRLKVLGYFKGYESGIYKDDLKHALFKFQKDFGLQIQNTITKAAWLAMGFREFE